uniref:Uncharacterized protein TCIL3000_11_6280 n=2 Tax=Trypanosoma congolense (strain IL3000) TaxID=1068625 RepID=G0V0N4_TRYCI|nr:unnamed protein product [Trypanosoma congolense IL3000]
MAGLISMVLLATICLQERSGTKGETLLVTAKENKSAYATVVTNEEYVDGALVLGFSLVSNSLLVRESKVELVLITPKGRLSNNSIQRLRCAGWNRIVNVSDLAEYAFLSTLRETLNKIHVFGLKNYFRVALFDSDSIIVRNPDYIFDTPLPSAEYVAAVRSKKSDYFHTAVMLLVPTARVFNSLLDRLKGEKRLQGQAARDGEVIRDYFRNRSVGIDGMFCAPYEWAGRNMNRVTSIHYSGKIKPWTKPLRLRKGQLNNKDGNGKPLGKAYQFWWHTYEQLHMRCMRDEDEKMFLTLLGIAVPAVGNPPTRYNSSESVWVMRYTRKSFVQPIGLLQNLSIYTTQELEAG